MFVLVDDRQTGKTSKLIAWLLDGEPRNNYPGWSRIIVCATHQEVVRVTHLVKKTTQNDWDIWTQAPDGDTRRHKRLRELSSLRKAVWGLEDLRTGFYGTGREEFQYAVDDIHRLLGRVLHIYKPPEIITINGKAWT